MIFCILGKMSSGKSTVLKKLSNNPSLEPVVITTTRSMRSNEKEGVDYRFVSEEDFFDHDLVEHTQFNGWYYGTPKNAIDLTKHQIIVVNPQGLESFINIFGSDNVVAFVIHRKDRDRAIDYLVRDENASVQEMLRRFDADYKDFADIFKLTDANVYHIMNETGKFDECVLQIEEIIGGYIDG